LISTYSFELSESVSSWTQNVRSAVEKVFFCGNAVSV
jgi:hypothetical protein